MEIAAVTATTALPELTTAVVPEKTDRKRLNRMASVSTMERFCKWDDFLTMLRQAVDGSLRDLPSGGIGNADKNMGFSSWQLKLLADARAVADPARFTEEMKKLDDQIHELRKTLKQKSVALALNVHDAGGECIASDTYGGTLSIDSDYAGRKQTLYEERTQLVTEVGWMRAVKQRLAAELKRVMQSCKTVCVSEPNFALSKPRPLLSQLGLTAALDKTRANYNLARQEALCHLHTNIDLQKQISLIYNRIHSLEAQLDAQVHALRALEARSVLTQRHAESEIASRESARRTRALANNPATRATEEQMKQMWDVIENERAVRARMEAFDSDGKIAKVLLFHLYHDCAPIEAHAVDDNQDLARQLQLQVNALEEKVRLQNSTHRSAEAKMEREMADAILKVAQAEDELKTLADLELRGLETQKAELEESLHNLAMDPFTLAANDLNGLYLWIVCDAAVDAPVMSEHNFLWELQSALGVDKAQLSLLSVADEMFENDGFGPPMLYCRLPKLDRRCDARPMSRVLVLVGATARDFAERVDKVIAFGKSMDSHALFLQLEVSRGAKSVAADMDAPAVVIGHSFNGVTHALLSARYSTAPPALKITVSDSDTREEHTLCLLQKDVEFFLNDKWEPKRTWTRRQACVNIRVVVNKLIPFLALRTIIGGRFPQRMLIAIQTYRRSMRLPPFEEAKVMIGVHQRMPLQTTLSSWQRLLFETLVPVPRAMQTGSEEKERKPNEASEFDERDVEEGSPSKTPGRGVGVEGFLLLRFGMDRAAHTYIAPYKLLVQLQSRMPGEQTHVILELRPGSSYFVVHLGSARVTVSTSFGQVHVEVCASMTGDTDGKTQHAKVNVIGDECFGWDGVRQAKKTLHLDRLLCMADTDHSVVSPSPTQKRDEKTIVPIKRTLPSNATAVIEALKAGKKDKEKRSSVAPSKALPAEERVVTLEHDIAEWNMPSTLLWRKPLFVQSSLRILSCYTNTRMYCLDVYDPVTSANNHCISCIDPLTHLDTLSIDESSAHPITFGVARPALSRLDLGWQPAAASTSGATPTVSVHGVPLHTFNFAGVKWRYCGHGQLTVGGSDVFAIAPLSPAHSTVAAFGWSGHINAVSADTKVHILIVRRTKKTLIRIECDGSTSTNADAPLAYKMSIEEDNRDVAQNIGDISTLFALPANMKCKALRENLMAIGFGTMMKDGFTTKDMHFVLPPAGDVLCCFMPRNCRNVREECVVAIRQNRDVVWRNGSASWGTKPKKMPLRKMLKEFESKLPVSTLSPKKLLHRATRFVRCLESLGDASSRVTCLGKLDHPIGTSPDATNPTVISIYHCVQSDSSNSEQQVAFQMELYNPVDNKRSWVAIPKGYPVDADIMNRIYCSPGGISLYLDDLPDLQEGDHVTRVNNVEVRRFTTTMDNVAYTTNLRVLIPPRSFDIHEDDLRQWLLKAEEKEGRANSTKDTSMGLHLLEPSWESELINWVATNARLDEEMNLTFEGV